MFLPLIVLNKSLTFSQFLHIAPQLFLWSTRCLVFAVIAWCSMPLEFPGKDVWCVWENKCPLDLNQRTYKWGEPYFIVHVLFARSLKANFSPPPHHLHLHPPPPPTPSTVPPSSLSSLSCAINNSLFCAVPCEWRHTQSQGHGARGDCWVGASWAGHRLDSRLGAWILPRQEGRGGLICLAVSSGGHLLRWLPNQGYFCS